MHGCCWQHGCILLRLQTTEQTMRQKEIMDRFIKWLLSLNCIFFPFLFQRPWSCALCLTLLYCFLAFWGIVLLQPSRCNKTQAAVVDHKVPFALTIPPPPLLFCFFQSLSSELNLKVKNVLFWRKSYWDAFNAICYIQREKKTCSRFTKKRECCSKKPIPSRRREREAHHS